MNNEKTRNDFLFFQNEMLGDMKKMETKISQKISQITSIIDTQLQKNENNIKDLTNKFFLLSKTIEEQNNSRKNDESQLKDKKRLEELFTKLDVRLNILEKDFNNACFKYDRMFSNNLAVPGLIGPSCPYDSLKPFLEYTNLKISELLKARDKQNIDTKRYKEKMELIIGQNKAQFEITENKINEFCSHGFKQCDIICKDRMDLIGKNIENLRLENGQYAQELKQKTEEIQIDWDKLNEIENTLNNKYKEECNKLNNLIDKLTTKYDKYKDEFYLLRNKFSELNEFIKDIKLRRNLGEINMGEIPSERRQNKQMSHRINFNKNYRNISENKVSGSYDFYNKQFYQEPIIEKNKNINYNINNINEIKINNNYIENNDNKKEKDIKKNSKDINQNNKIFKENDNLPKKKFSKFFNNKITNGKLDLNKNNIKINEIIINSEYQKENSAKNIDNNEKINNSNLKKEKGQDIKPINIKSKNKQINNDIDEHNIINYNSDNSNTYNIVNYSYNLINHRNNNNKININNIEQKNFGKNNLKNQEQSMQCVNNFMNIEENAKINDLVLGADFSNNNLYQMNGPTYNLSQAYIIIKRRNQKLEKIKKNHGGKSEQKFNQYNHLSPSNIINYNRNLNNYNNFKNFPKNFNKDDFFYSSLKKEKQKNLNITNQYNTERKNFPRLIKDNKKQINSNTIDQNNIYSTYINDDNKRIFKNANNTNEDSNTININDNSLESKSLSPRRINISKHQKKLLYSSSDMNIKAQITPKTPNYKGIFSIDNIDEKNQTIKYTIEENAKETLNHINPYLIKLSDFYKIF